MHWIYTNVDHLTVPFGILLSLISAFIGFTIQRKRKAGLTPPYIPNGVRIIATLIVMVGLVFFGIVLAHTFGT